MPISSPTAATTTASSEPGRQRVADAPGAFLAALLAARRRAVAHDALRPAAHAGRRRAGAAHQPVRSAGILRLGRPPAGHRGRVGIRGAVGPSGVPLGPAVGVDRVAVRALSGLRGGPLPRIFGAVVHHQPGAARRLLRHAGATGLAQVPQFLSAGARRYLRRPAHLRLAALTTAGGCRYGGSLLACRPLWIFFYLSFYFVLLSSI